MTKIHKFIISVSVVLVGAVALVGGAFVVHAQINQTQANRFAGTQAQFQQMIQARLAAISQIAHKRVCDVATGDSAACNAQVVMDASGRAKANAVPSAYGPSQLLGAYNLASSSSLNPGPIIAIVDAYDDPNIVKDLSTYSSMYGIPQLPTCSGSITTSGSACFQKMNENGATSPLPQSNSSWALEISLDVEIAHATCQNCRILLVEANSASYADLLKAVDTAVANNATVVSGSWGGGESSIETTSYDSHFAKTGVAFTFSAGDSGYGTLYPAASQYVTAVGGTTLLVNTSTNQYEYESVWNGTGSGCSAYEAKPSWQTDTASGDCAMRTMNDVAADADPATGAAVYDSVRYDGMSGWFQVGGTSLSAPIIAAAYALAGGVPTGVRANSMPYTSGEFYNLNDITAGSNGTCGTYLCNAEVGYDGPTGLGTPYGTSAAPLPPPPPPPPAQSFSLAVSPSSLSIAQGSSGNYTITVNPAGGFTGSVTLSVSGGLPSGASASFGPNPAMSSSVLKINVGSRTPAGTYTLTVKGVSGSLSNTTSATLTVTQRRALFTR